MSFIALIYFRKGGQAKLLIVLKLKVFKKIADDASIFFKYE